MLVELALSLPQPESNVIDAINEMHNVRKLLLFKIICIFHCIYNYYDSNRYRVSVDIYTVECPAFCMIFTLNQSTFCET